MSTHRTAGVLLAATAAALFSTANIVNAAEESAATDQVKCSGINACKGTSECATASSACKGQNSCKGHGWINASQSECDEKGGTVVK
jgi:uncharacterized membrane protein